MRFEQGRYLEAAADYERARALLGDDDRYRLGMAPAPPTRWPVAKRGSDHPPTPEPGVEVHVAGQFFPYVIQRDMYGQKIAPENLGSVESVSFFGLATRFPADMVASVERNLVVRDGWAAGYFHPFLYADDPTLLEELVTGIRALGFTFVPLSKDMQ